MAPKNLCCVKQAIKTIIFILTIVFYTSNCVGQPKIGDTMIDIFGKDVNKNLQSTAPFHQGLLLVDFWASWCRPCRRYGLPWVNQMYKTYHSKGLQVFSLSLDHDYSVWKKTLQTDSCLGVQVYDAAAWQSIVVKMYHIKSIPSKLLFYNGLLIMANKSMVEMEAEIIKYLQ